MPLSSLELWRRLSTEGLATPQQCRIWAADVAKRLPPSEVNDGQRVLQELVTLGTVTDYQAQVLVGDKPNRLRLGELIVRRPLNGPLWTDWFEIEERRSSDTENAAEDVAAEEQTNSGPEATTNNAPGGPARYWGRWVGLADLERLESSLPTLSRCEQLTAVTSRQIQQVFPPKRDGDQIVLRVSPSVGRLWSDVFRSRATNARSAGKFRDSRPASETSVQLIREAAKGLAALHSQGLVHGRVLPDRLQLHSDGAVQLICDPLALLTASGEPHSSGLIGEQLDGLGTQQFIAPEFLAPGQLPSPATDIYSLGCTWYWLLTGEPFATTPSGSTLKTPSGHRLSPEAIQSVLSQHAEKPIELPPECELPIPYLRCLQHCLAKNPAARFTSAAALLAAMDAAEAIIARTKTADQPAQPAKAQPRSMERETGDSGNASKRTSRKPAQSGTLNRSVESLESSPPPAQPLSGKDRSERAGKSSSTDHLKTSSSRSASSSNTMGKAPSAPHRSQSSKRAGRRSRRQANKWFLPAIAGFGFVILLLFILKLSGALQPSPEVAQKPREPYRPSPTSSPKPSGIDPLLKHYQLVDTSREVPWAPPAPPNPLPLDGLPPGGQLFLSVRPSEFLANPHSKHLNQTFETSLQPFQTYVEQATGVPLSSIRHLIIACYSAPEPGAFPQIAGRVELVDAQSIDSLQRAWGSTREQRIDDQSVWLASEQRAYFIIAQSVDSPPSNAVDGQLQGGMEKSGVETFSFGSPSLIEQVAANRGGVAPLTSQLEQLWRRTCLDAEFTLLFSPRYLFAEGRGLLKEAPPPITDHLRDLLGRDSRAAMLETRFTPKWYLELQLLGESDQQTAARLADMQRSLDSAAERFEGWLVDETPHPYWRALALRFPQMLRVLSQQTRFGIENGVAVVNSYLPVEAAPNVLLASWLASQPYATAVSGTRDEPMTDSPSSPMSVVDVLERAIDIRFDQEPIEQAFILIGEAAKDGLPVGTPSIQFKLDGDAFENAGITRNQQIRDFDTSGRPVRDALTELVKLGNPVTTVESTHAVDQKLIWVVVENTAEPPTVLLTTRSAAQKARWSLPSEFKPTDAPEQPTQP